MRPCKNCGSNLVQVTATLIACPKCSASVPLTGFKRKQYNPKVAVERLKQESQHRVEELRKLYS